MVGDGGWYVQVPGKNFNNAKIKNKKNETTIQICKHKLRVQEQKDFTAKS